MCYNFFIYTVFIISSPDIRLNCYKNTTNSRTKKENNEIYENRKLSVIEKSALNLRNEQIARKKVEKILNTISSHTWPIRVMLVTIVTDGCVWCLQPSFPKY